MRRLFEETKPFFAGIATLVFAVLIAFLMSYFSFELIGGVK